MQIPSTETLEIDASGREAIVLDVALPVLAAWKLSVSVVGFRPSMGVSGLSPREAVRLRTLGLASASRATGVFEGANDFRLGYRPQIGLSSTAPALGIKADLAGHPLAPVVSDLTIACFGLPLGQTLTHRLEGFTHLRAAGAQGYGARALSALAREFGLVLSVTTEELGFEPQGLGSVSVVAARTAPSPHRTTEWRDRGDLKAVHLLLGGVRPRQEQLARLEAELREGLWEARRIEPTITRQVSAGIDSGAFLQVDVECERGGATFMDVVGRSAAPLSTARRAVRRIASYWDSEATFDETTGVAALACAIAAGGHLEIALAPSEQLSLSLGVLREIGALVDEREAPGLLILRTTPR